jgi:hypothetical protein
MPSGPPQTRFLCSVIVLDKYLMVSDITTLVYNCRYNVHVAA